MHLSRALSVHHLGRERLRLSEVDEVLVGRFVRKQHRQILERVGGHRGRHTSEERTQFLFPLTMIAIKTERAYQIRAERADDNLIGRTVLKAFADCIGRAGGVVFRGRHE